MTDAAFTANYLKQQGHRDPGIARFIQKAIRRRVRSRLAMVSPSPATLEEFCQVVKWEDVRDTVEATLIREEQAVIAALS